LEGRLDRMSRLAENLPKGDSYQNTIEDLRKRLSQIRSGATPKAFDDDSPAETEIEARARHVATLIEFSEPKLLSEVEKVRLRRERYYEMFTWVSYGLYALGWAVGLAGRLFRIEGLNIEE